MNSAYWAFDGMTDLIDDACAGRFERVQEVWDEYEVASVSTPERRLS
jgi:hypothetical protein